MPKAKLSPIDTIRTSIPCAPPATQFYVQSINMDPWSLTAPMIVLTIEFPGSKTDNVFFSLHTTKDEYNFLVDNSKLLMALKCVTWEPSVSNNVNSDGTIRIWRPAFTHANLLHIFNDKSSEENKRPFPVLYFISKKFSNTHVFMIEFLVWNYVLGLPSIRQMKLPNGIKIQDHISRTAKWGTVPALHERLFWNPLPETAETQKEPGCFTYFLPDGKGSKTVVADADDDGQFMPIGIRRPRLQPPGELC